MSAHVRARPNRARSTRRPARKAATLMAGRFGSRHFGTKPFLADAVKLTGKDKPVALYVGVASGDNDEFGAALGGLLSAAGVHEVLWPKLARTSKAAARTRDALAEVDLVFVGGGDVEAGMRRLEELDLVAEFRAAADRGAVFAGMSAGSIMLGERWIRWPSEDASDHEAETYECLGVVPVSLDTHGESDGWRETRSFAAVRARELGREACAYAVPSGGALVIDGDGTARARGVPVPVFAAAPNAKPRIKKTLEVRE